MISGQRHWDLGFEERSPKAYQDTLCLALARDNPSRGTDYTTGNLVHGALTSLRLFTKQHRQPLLKIAMRNPANQSSPVPISCCFQSTSLVHASIEGYGDRNG
ncbi:uncharacterized protein LOC127769346 [Oryza glaberrima]|uniref:uncharacterized protein LOC127769346 n=1 Tax=Oryza glaberrima TaxID=4538 RepID=UPI00224BF2C0|nr:uncharacterized protein LOC127769346 [Oryza glaberrima]